MADKKPWVQVASLCERVLQEPDGVLTPVRLVDVLTLKAVLIPKPADAPQDAKQVQVVPVMDLWILVSLKSGDLSGEFKLSLRMRDPNDKVVPMATDLPVVLKGDDGVNLKLQFGLPLNAPEGRYWFEVFWNDEELTRFPLRLKREVEQGAADSGKPH